jgi:hypothetical protein
MALDLDSHASQTEVFGKLLALEGLQLRCFDAEIDMALVIEAFKGSPACRSASIQAN